jgi:hypothetical protein
VFVAAYITVAIITLISVHYQWCSLSGALLCAQESHGACWNHTVPPQRIWTYRSHVRLKKLCSSVLAFIKFSCLHHMHCQRCTQACKSIVSLYFCTSGRGSKHYFVFCFIHSVYLWSLLHSVPCSSLLLVRQCCH